MSFEFNEFLPAPLICEDELHKHLGRCGKGTKVFRGCRLVPPEKISLGDFSQIDENVMIFAGTGVEIGRHVHLAFGSSIFGGGSCKIHDFVGISSGVRLITGTDLPDGGLTNPTVPRHLRLVHRGRIEIGAHALIYTNALILPDVTIGDGAVVSAGTIVHRNLDPWTVYGGTPMVKIGHRSAEKVLKSAAQIS